MVKTVANIKHAITSLASTLCGRSLLLTFSQDAFLSGISTEYLKGFHNKRDFPLDAALQDVFYSKGAPCIEQHTFVFELH